MAVISSDLAIGKMRQQEDNNAHLPKKQKQDNNAAKDRFSRLPIPIIHDILSYLPTEEIVRTSVLSETWKGIWSSFPVFNFDGYLFRDKSIRIWKHCEQGEVDINWEFLRINFWRSLKVRNEEFIHFVGSTLSRICANDLTLDKFKLVFFQYNNCEYASQVDGWMEQLKRYQLQMLELCFFAPQDRNRESYYCLPLDSFSCMSNSIITLRLTGCKIEVSLLGKLVSLQELSLRNVHIDGDGDVIKVLDATCPSIKILCLMCCFGVKNNLDLSRLIQLEKVVVYESCKYESDISIESVTMKAPNLRTFHYLGYDHKLCKIDARASCKSSLKELILRHTRTEATTLQEIISSFPFLCTLVLQQLDVDEGRTTRRRINICGQHLQTLRLEDLFYLDDLEIDAPNVRSFQFKCVDTKLSRIKVNISSSLCKSKLLFLGNPVDIPATGDTPLTCFHHIREFLQNIGPNTSLTVHISSSNQEDNTVFKESTEISKPPPRPVSLDYLKIEIGRQPKDSSYELHHKFYKVIDGLLWSCYPKKLSVVLWLGHYKANDYRAYYTFLQCLCETLIKRGYHNRDCYTSADRTECWRHCLVDYCITPVGDKRPFDSCDALLASLPTTMEEAWDSDHDAQPRVDQEFHFQFQWKSSIL